MNSITVYSKVILLLCTASIFAQDQAKQSNELIASLASRQEKLHDFSIDIKMTETKTKGSLSNDINAHSIARPNTKNNTNATTPEKDIINTFDVNLKFHNDHILCTEGQPIFDMISNTFLKCTITTCFNGDVIKKLLEFDNNKPSIITTNGIIDDSKSKNYFRNYTYLPIMLSARGYMNNWSSYNFKGFKKTNNTLSIRGKKCVEFVSHENDIDFARIWSDPNSHYSILRIEVIKKGKLNFLCDIEYSENTQINEWLPSKWSAICFDNGIPIKKLNATVANLDIAENSIAKQVDFEFPIGIRISDNRVGKAYIMDENRVMHQVDVDNNRVGNTAFSPDATFFQKYNFTIVLVITCVSLFSLVYIYKKLKANSKS